MNKLKFSVTTTTHYCVKWSYLYGSAQCECDANRCISFGIKMKYFEYCIYTAHIIWLHKWNLFVPWAWIDVMLLHYQRSIHTIYVVCARAKITLISRLIIHVIVRSQTSFSVYVLFNPCKMADLSPVIDCARQIPWEMPPNRIPIQ